MAYINDEAFDGGLDYADVNGTRLDILNADAGAVYANVATFTVGNKTGLNTSAPADAGTGTGREVTVPAITDGTVTATGTATHWALTDGAAILVASGILSASQGVTNANTFTLDAILLTIRDAT